MSDTDGNGVPTSFVFGAFALSTTCVIRAVIVRLVVCMVFTMIVPVIILATMAIFGASVLSTIIPTCTSAAATSAKSMIAFTIIGMLCQARPRNCDCKKAH